MLSIFQKFSEVRIVFSLRENGNMKIGTAGWKENRHHFFALKGIDDSSVVSADLVHGSRVKVVQGGEGIVSGVDALVTKEKGIFLSVTVADCFPVFFYEKEAGIVAIAHAGWRGIIEGIVPETVSKIMELGGKAESIEVAIGPGIGKCHFEIQNDVVEKFQQYPIFLEERGARKFVDLRGIILAQLEKERVKKENIENESLCTFCEGKYFSYRRDKPQEPEAMIAMIAMK